MTLRLTVDGERWRRHLRSVADRTPGLVPVADEFNGEVGVVVIR